MGDTSRTLGPDAVTPRSSTAPEADAAWLERVKTGWFTASALPHYKLTRFMFLRALGFIYFVAFVCLARELDGLISSHGILPVGPFLRRVLEHAPSTGAAFWRLPSVFWLTHSDSVLTLGAWLGVGASLVVVAGYANAWLLACLWALYLSFVNVGQIFYGYGWEMAGGWWSRTLVGEYLRPLSLHDPELDAFLTDFGWL